MRSNNRTDCHFSAPAVAGFPRFSISRRSNKKSSSRRRLSRLTRSPPAYSMDAVIFARHFLA
jgi:hypothetical protein